MVDIHANVLGRYERGEARPFVEMAAKLAQALEVSLDYLVGNSDPQIRQRNNQQNCQPSSTQRRRKINHIQNCRCIYKRY